MIFNKIYTFTPPLSLSQEVKQNIKLVQKKTWNYDIIIQKYIKKIKKKKHFL